MDKQERSPLSILRGQLKLGLSEEVKKETLPEEIFAFAKGFLFYCQRRVLGVSYFFWHTFASGLGLTTQLKLYVQGRLYRRKGQLAFPLVHASLLTISFSLLIFTSGFGEFLYQKTSNLSLGEGAAIVVDQPPIATEESQLLQTEVQTYIVEEGDTLYDIAHQFRVTADTLAYANGLSEPYVIRPGDELIIPPVEGLIYKVRMGDTIDSIAKKYQADPQRIVEFNYLFSPYKLVADQELIVPFAQIPQPKPTYTVSSGGFLGAVSSPTGSCGPLTLNWPTVIQSVIGSYTYYHRAVDLPANYEPLYAAASGVVTAVGEHGTCLSFSRYCNYGYGGYVFINVGGGYQIRYGHISKALVGVGQEVSRGEVVAISGESGMAFAPHLHFELLCNGTKINPLLYFR